MTYTLAIGDRSYSSWSLRGWLMFARFGLPVTLRTAPMTTPAFAEMLTHFGAARTVPALRIEGEGPPVALWDTLAIAETLAERHPEIRFWPAPPADRALARTLAAEMHAGFAALRTDCPVNLRRAYTGFRPSDAVRADLARIEELWRFAQPARAEGGDWLFGAYSLADVFFAPAAARIATWGLEVGPEAAAYVAAHLAEPCFLEWRAAALAEPHPIPQYDRDLPERPWPGPQR